MRWRESEEEEMESDTDRERETQRQREREREVSSFLTSPSVSVFSTEETSTEHNSTDREGH